MFKLNKDQIVVQQSGAEGFAVAESSGYLAALKTDLSEELIQEGLAREVVRRVQQLRKDADLDIADRIEVVYQASAGLQVAIENFAEYIASETLANSITAGNADGFEHVVSDEFDSETLTAALRKI